MFLRNIGSSCGAYPMRARKAQILITLKIEAIYSSETSTRCEMHTRCELGRLKSLVTPSGDMLLPNVGSY
jgi:hypothetical protein